MKKILISLATLVLIATPVYSKERSIAVTDNTALFLPIAAEWGVNFFVEKVDGEKTKFGLYDSVVVDAGERTLDIRLEYAPSSGSSVLVGGLGSLLLRAATNKTFRTQMEVSVEGGKTYQMTATAKDDLLEIFVVDHTDELILTSQRFQLKDGKFERLF